MFDWFYNRVADAIIGKFEGWISEPKNVEAITKMMDSLADRQVHRLMSSIGGSQKGIIEQTQGPGGFDIGNLLSGRGGLSSKKLIGFFLSNLFQGKLESQSQNQSQNLNSTTDIHELRRRSQIG